MKVRDEVSKVSRPISYLTTNQDGIVVSGVVLTKYAIVEIYHYHSGNAMTTFTVVKDGLQHTRTANRRYTKRGLVTLANRFAKEVFGN